MRGKTLGQVHTVFTDRVQGLRDGVAAQAKAFQEGGARPLLLPGILRGRDLLHVPSLHDSAWDRNEANRNYDQVTQSAAEPGTCGDAASLKLQIDWTAAEERAFRARHATQLRCLVHAQSRLQGHSRPEGVFDRIASTAAGLIKAGSTT